MTDVSKDFVRIPATAVSDALNGLTNMEQSIKPLNPDTHAAGRAYTVKLRAADNKLVMKGIKEAQEGDILVIDAKGYMENASCGDFVIGVAKTMGLGGVVIDGAVRDMNGILDLDFPVFCKGTTAAASDKHGSGETGVPISCGSTVVRTGDIIVGDIDGVVVVPQEKAQDILDKSKEKIVKDEEREEKVLKNRESALEYINKQLS